MGNETHEEVIDETPAADARLDPDAAEIPVTAEEDEAFGEIDAKEPKATEPEHAPQTRREQLGILAHTQGVAQKEVVGQKTFTVTYDEVLTVEPDNSEHTELVEVNRTEV